MIKMREQLLAELIGYREDIHVLVQQLKQFPWDSNRALIVLTRGTMAQVLQRFLVGALSNEQIENWANAIEGRDDIDYEPGHEDLMQEMIYQLANPLLTEAITSAHVEKLWKALKMN